MERYAPRARSDAYGRRINRTHSPLVATVLPWLTILAGSILPVFFMATALPVVPPFGFLMLLAWRLVRPGLLPIWAGLPLGLFDDLFSGQPFGSAILLWSAVMIGFEVLDRRIPWRTFLQDWLAASAVLAGYLFLAFLLSGGDSGSAGLIALGPQLLFAIVLFPAAAGLVAMVDRLRLFRWLAA
ncbi:rod shape-determining protein MreD [Qipengyuania sp.]|uniref:rod shape-determining protein MreD n=1 Tax=Qipengyuania sp. TaxID=2004515 RepID=UPI0035C81564